MSYLDNFINRRETVLNWTLGTPADKVLNNRGFPGPIARDISLAQELKDKLNQVKSLSIRENGKVDYQKLVQDPLYQAFRTLAGELQYFDFGYLKTPEEKLAFWINLYNSLVIDAVIQEIIQESVTESWLGIMAFFQKSAYRINNLRFSLTDIEHGLLRANRGFPYLPGSHFASSDPRLKAAVQPFTPLIHFALNCASNSCPPINVYTPDKLWEQLKMAAGNFIDQDLAVDMDQKVIWISQIFRWYQIDFGGRSGILDFLARTVRGNEIRSWILENSSSIRIKYHPYDWGLNKINK